MYYVVIYKVFKNEILIVDFGNGIIKYIFEEFFKIWIGVLILMVLIFLFKKGDEIKGLFERFWGLIRV